VTPSQKAFVIQLDVRNAGASEPMLTGWVEDLDSGATARFDSGAGLVVFLTQALRSAGTDPAGSGN
jgi:hypothetical protein